MPTFNPDKPMSKLKSTITPKPLQAIYFDIETEPREDALDGVDDSEFAPPANWKDPEKIAAKIAENKARARQDAALSAMTGRVLCIGVAADDGPVDVLEGDEKVILERFLDMARNAIYNGNRMFGYNILNFDLPFIGQRAVALGVQVPIGLYSYFRGRFYWHEHFRDCMEMFKFGLKDHRGMSLKRVSKLLNLPIQKEGDGADCPALYRSDRDKAIAYVKRDVDVTRLLAKRLFAV
jgi:DNA polymerase elongation subunit (family B)